MLKLLLSSTLCAVCFIAICYAEAGFSQDTYLNALQSSHHTQDIETNNGYDYPQPSNNKYHAETNNGYDYPQPSSNNYHPPQPIYGPPAPVYGPPAPIYGPPIGFYKPTLHPRDDWFWNKLKTKINLFAIGKILLKLLIFKKIIKFIGVICLLLFLPKLKNMFKDDMPIDDDGLDRNQIRTDRDILAEQIDEFYKFALKAFASYQGTDGTGTETM